MAKSRRIKVGAKSATPRWALVDVEDYPLVAPVTWSPGRSGADVIAIGRTDQKMVSMHRLILGAGPTDQIEHLNGNKLDNRRVNLRVRERRFQPVPDIDLPPRPPGTVIQVGGHRFYAGKPARAMWALVDPEDLEMLSAYRWTPHLHSDGRLKRVVGRDRPRGPLVLMHRVVMGVTFGDPRIVDHVNRNPLDNRRENLRFCTKSENGQNVGLRRGSKGDRRPSRYRGVGYQAGRPLPWSITLRFPTEDEAHEWATRWRREYMPFSEMDKTEEERAAEAQARRALAPNL